MTGAELLNLLATVADIGLGASALALTVLLRAELRAVAARVGVVERRHKRPNGVRRAATEPGAVS